MPGQGTAPMPSVVGAGTLVPVLGGERRYVALDNAARTPPFAAVRDAVHRAPEW